MTEQKPAQKPEAAGGGWRIAVYVVLAIPVLIFGGCAALLVIGSNESDKLHSSDALLACRAAVKAKLKNPATADFPFGGGSIDERSGGGWDVTGTLTAKNSFGVPQELVFTCATDASARVIQADVLE
jgi:hypothetical protein